MIVVGNQGDYVFGSMLNVSDYYVDFNVGEMIVYNMNFSMIDIKKVELYLVMKYGIILFGDYVVMDGSIIWIIDVIY